MPPTDPAAATAAASDAAALRHNLERMQGHFREPHCVCAVRDLATNTLVALLSRLDADAAAAAQWAAERAAHRAALTEVMVQVFDFEERNRTSVLATKAIRDALACLPPGTLPGGPDAQS